MIRTPFIAIVFLAVAARVSAQPLGDEKSKALCDLAQMPFLRIHVEVTNDGDFEGVTIDRVREIAALEKSLGGGVADVERCRRLNGLYWDAGKQKEIAGRALAIALKLRQEDPRNGRYALALGQAYSLAEQTSEAEKYLREAVTLLPADYDCRTSLGTCLLARAAAALLEDQAGPPSAKKWDSGMPKLRDSAKCRFALQEAEANFDKAVEIAPNSRKSYLDRANFRIGASLVRKSIDADVSNDGSAVENERTLSDLQKCAELSETPSDIGVPMWQYISIAKSSAWMLPAVIGDDSPERTKALRVIDAANKRLEAIALHPDPGVAGAACYVRAALEFQRNVSVKNAMPYLRRDEQMHPELTRSTRMIDLQLGMEKRVGELVKHCEERVRVRDNPFSRYLLAAYFFNLKQYDVAEGHLRSGLKVAPDDLECNLALAGLLMRRGNQAFLVEVDRLLTMAESNSSPKLADRQDVIAFRSIYLALTGDSEAARTRLRDLVAKQPGNRLAGNVLRVIGD